MIKMVLEERLLEHYNEAKSIFPEERIVGIFVYGSQNYGLDTPESDLDTKCIIVPTFEEICFNKKPVSYTHVRANNEHIEFKDIRLMMKEFRKQNMNFVEILFTKYYILGPVHGKTWLENVLVHREEIARYRTLHTVRTMAAMAEQKQKDLCKPSSARADVLAQFGYDPKQLCHQIRILKFIMDYKEGKPYAECMYPSGWEDYIRWVKEGNMPLGLAQSESDKIQRLIEAEVEDYARKVEDITNTQVDELLDNAQRLIVANALREELA
jgi:predicted nucleotidyltransferase